ncbi:MAG: hypothetical protein HY673_14665 [Chloroflexi bacterium]|nr:hypothetical protein [Chloroflexota bacterium]
MKDKQSWPGQDIRDLWVRGKLWEIFGFTGDDFTALELAKRYSALKRMPGAGTEDASIIDDAFATLNAPLTRRLYNDSRAKMLQIKQSIGEATYARVEDKVWADLWGWVSQRWQDPPHELVRALKIKYLHSVPQAAANIAREDAQSAAKGHEIDIDALVAAESFMREVKCQGCGRFDHTLRVAAFPYVVSIIVASFKRFGQSGIFCHSCRTRKSTGWAVISLLFGWWSMWGFFWTIGALIDNFRGGKMPAENNKPLLAGLVQASIGLGRIDQAKAALHALLGLEADGGVDEKAIHLKDELDRKYPGVAPARQAGFRFGLLSLFVGIFALYGFVGYGLFGGSHGSGSSPPTPSPQPASVNYSPSAVVPAKPGLSPTTRSLSPTPLQRAGATLSTTSTNRGAPVPTLLTNSLDPPYVSDTGQKVVLTNQDFAKPTRWNDLLRVAESLLSEIIPYTKQNSSGLASNVVLHNRLEDQGIKSALVGVNAQGSKPFFACVAVETTDRGVVFVDIIPQTINAKSSFDRSELIQSVFLKPGNKIGFIAAKFVDSGDYSWYESYLSKVYDFYDFGIYLDEYADVVKRNRSRLDSIQETIEEIRRYMDDNTNSRNILFVGLFNRKIDRFNNYIARFNGQLEDYRKDVSFYKELEGKYPDSIYYVVETRGVVNPLPTSVLPRLSVIVPSPVAPGTLRLEMLLNSDDSYNQIPKPNRERAKKSERFADKNFRVTDFAMWW